jgi:hypothetical protein
MVEAGKTRLTETIPAENRKSPLTDLAFRELPLIFATVISTYDLVIGAPLTYQYQSAKLLSQSKTRMQKTLNLAFIIIGRLRVVLYATAHSHVF